MTKFTGFGDMHVKLHGLSKKVLKFSVNIAYCQIMGIKLSSESLGMQYNFWMQQ